MRESEIEAHLVKRVKELKGETRKLKFINRRGAPDRLVWIPTWPAPRMPEMKRPGKKLEDHQRREHKRLKRMGIITCKLDTKEDVDRFLS